MKVRRRCNFDKSLEQKRVLNEKRCRELDDDDDFTFFTSLDCSLKVHPFHFFPLKGHHKSSSMSPCEQKVSIIFKLSIFSLFHFTLVIIQFFSSLATATKMESCTAMSNVDSHAAFWQKHHIPINLPSSAHCRRVRWLKIQNVTKREKISFSFKLKSNNQQQQSAHCWWWRQNNSLESQISSPWLDMCGSHFAGSAALRRRRGDETLIRIVCRMKREKMTKMTTISHTFRRYTSKRYIHSPRCSVLGSTTFSSSRSPLIFNGFSLWLTRGVAADLYITKHKFSSHICALSGLLYFFKDNFKSSWNDERRRCRVHKSFLKSNFYST